VKNLPGYYSGVLSVLIEKALFGDAYKAYDVSIEGKLEVGTLVTQCFEK